MPPEKDARIYRILFCLAVLVGFFMAFQIWRARQVQLVDVGQISRSRDKPYLFTVDAYGFTYKGKTGAIVDEQVLLFGLYEKDRLFFMRDYLRNAKKEDAVVLDVGANTGNHALFLSRCVSQGKVHAFEPFPPVIKRFRENLAINPAITNIELHELGLSDKEAELSFVAPDDENEGSGSFQINSSREPGHKVYGRKLKVVAADAYLGDKRIGPIAFVKMDIEGHEEAALKGMREILTRDRPVVVVEVGALPIGTIETFAKLRSLFPENYDFLAFENDLAGAANGRYTLRLLSDKVFAELRSGKLDVVAYPREQAAVVPQP
jgi:FkbM family methyltransferase